MAGRTTRRKLKRSLAQALNSLEKVHFDLETLLLQFDGHSGNFDKHLRLIMTANAAVHENILQFWENAWGKRPVDFHVWR